MSATLGADTDLAYLHLRAMPKSDQAVAPFSIVDLFAGCGGLTLGFIEGARRQGRAARLAVAIDNNAAPMAVLKDTIADAAAQFVDANLETTLRAFGDQVGHDERALFANVDGPCVLLAGPPCQGHSALNNRTRHNDPRNDLYLKVARAARIINPVAVIVENVRGVGSDRRSAMHRCAAALEELDYEVTEKRFDLCAIGVPQTRTRHVLVATRDFALDWAWGENTPRSVAWAIGDLADVASEDAFDSPSTPTDDNRRRMEWLFENDEHDLPNPLRPVCHRSEHSYVSMYGRLWWDRPAQTITSGYGSMGQGRFVHPLRPRTLTPHEAARLQCLPDFVAFARERRRKRLADMIGNAVPPLLGITLVEMLVEQGLI